MDLRRSPLATALATALLLCAGGQVRAQVAPDATAALDPATLASRVELPGGGVVWATEDPALTLPELSVQAAGLVAVDRGRIADPVNFQAYTNYPAFIDTLEVAIFAGTDTDLIEPLAIVPLPVGSTAHAEWNGSLPQALLLKPGDTLLYVVRARGKDGNFDETLPGRLQLVTPADRARGLDASRDRVRKALGEDLQGDAAEALEASQSIYGRGTLRQQNIVVRGSRVRLTGHGLALGTMVSIDGRPIPVDLDGKFAAEFLEPVGEHRYELAVKPRGGAESDHVLGVDVTGSYRFAVAIADLTIHGGSASSDPSATASAPGDDDVLRDGRLAFYLRSKFGGRYLLTAHADTGERELEHLFDGFFKPSPQDIFRRLDPDQYYPSYGDDSTTYRDVDTQGRLYLRLDWDQNQALWGNFLTGISGTEYARYNRALYGAALDWRSRSSTDLGEPRSELRVFGSEAQSAPGHNEFLGTGGSLYYLRHTDVLPGSESVVLEVRDAASGRIEGRTTLLEGRDYEIDAMQGRILLTRPLSQVTRENVRTLTRDAPLDGFEQRLLVDYEYIPPAFDPEDVSVGLRGRQWLGQHVAIGGTWVRENRGGDDYSLGGADVVLQAAKGTYLKMEQSRTESTVAPVFYSDDGGLAFSRLNPAGAGSQEGGARAVEARANLRELGWTQRDWSIGAWWRDVDQGYSVVRSDTGQAVHEQGAEFLGWLGANLSLYGKYSLAERGDDAFEQAQLTLDWRLGDTDRFGAEVRRVREIRAAVDIEATLAALSYRHRFDDALELYGTGQATVDDDGGKYPRNDLLTLGARYLFGDRSSIGAEVSSGSRGHGALADAEYRLRPDHSLYAAWRTTTDTTRDPLLASSAADNGLTLGQRWRIASQVSVHNESQWLKDRDAGSSGIAHTFGLDFTPAFGWNLGFTVMDGELENTAGITHRRAYSVTGGRTDPRSQWSSKLEFRHDSGVEQRDQWVTSNQLSYKVNEDWRLAMRANYADTRDALSPIAGATLAEGNLGVAWRPHDSTAWAAFGRYTYRYDLATLGQVGGSQYDQRTHVLSVEGIHRFDPSWELAAKLAVRRGDYRMGRGVGTWLDSTASFASMQLRYRLAGKWDALGEYRRLDVRDGGTNEGWLVGIDRQVGDHLRIGAGYNFTGFSDDLTDLRQDDHGWFLNMVGYY